MLRRLIDFTVTLILFAPPLLFAFFYVGPYQWLAEMQLAVMNEYYETLTFLLTLVTWVALCGLAWSWVNRARGRDVSPTEIVRTHDSIFARQLPSIVIMVATAFLFLAAYYEYRARITRDATLVRVEDFAHGFWAPGSYVRVDGARIEPDFALGMKESNSLFSGTSYLPLLGHGYQKGEPVHVFVQIPMDRLRDQPVDPQLLCAGLINLRSLPGMMRVAFERNALPPARSAVVILYGSKPDQLENEAGFYLICAGMVAVIGGLVWFRTCRTVTR
jgi:hypothetical protein